MTITEIENMNEEQVRDLAEKSKVVKEHNIYFITLENGFGYSYIVFKNGRQIKYANDYELHHSGRTKEELDKMYGTALNNKLFTDDEFGKDITDYDDFRRKKDYLINHYACRVENISGFQIFNNEDEKKKFKRKIKNCVFDPIGYCYVKDEAFAKEHVKIWNELIKKYNERLEDYDYLKSVIKYEMNNHEYAINWQGNWDVITSVFGDTEYDSNDNYHVYFDQLNLNETQRKAYIDARKEYFAECPEY